MFENSRRHIPAFCPLCVSRCGCEAVVENGRLVAIEPDPSHPTGKALCAKGRASPALVEAPDRLLYPLRRTPAEGRRRSRMATDLVGRGARRDGCCDAPDRDRERPRGGGLCRHDQLRDRDFRCAAVDRPAD
jgi:hypothetical protein